MPAYGSVDNPFVEAFGRIVEVHWPTGRATYEGHATAESMGLGTGSLGGGFVGYVGTGDLDFVSPKWLFGGAGAPGQNWEMSAEVALFMQLGPCPPDSHDPTFATPDTAHNTQTASYNATFTMYSLDVDGNPIETLTSTTIGGTLNNTSVSSPGHPGTDVTDLASGVLFASGSGATVVGIDVVVTTDPAVFPLGDRGFNVGYAPEVNACEVTDFPITV